MSRDELYKGPDLSDVDKRSSQLGEYTAADQARAFGVEISDIDVEVEVGGVYLPLPMAKALVAQEAKIVG